jgi:hypothetical protein
LELASSPAIFVSFANKPERKCGQHLHSNFFPSLIFSMMQELTFQEMADHDGGRLICILLALAIGAGAVAIGVSSGIGAVAGGVSAEALAIAEFIDQGC